MKAKYRSYFFLGILFTMSLFSFSQDPTDLTKIKLDPIKEKKFETYVEYRHSAGTDYQKWKSENKFQYIKEMWYFSESFYIKRNYSNDGVSMNEEAIDIARFEDNRKQNEEALVIIPGFKDVIVLLPANKLIYKP